MKTLALSILLGVLFLVPAAYAHSIEDNARWELPGDVLGTSNQISFNQGANDVWYFMQSSTLAQIESSYSLLPVYTTPCAEFGSSFNGLLCYYPTLPDGFPFIGLNVTATTQSPKTVTWPARTLAMHPAPGKLAIVGWRSPISGKIDVEGSFIDFDGSCGNGVQWFINEGNTTLRSGALVNGGKGGFHLANVKVHQGEALYFIVDPDNGESGCDTTGLHLTITGSRGQHNK